MSFSFRGRQINVPVFRQRRSRPHASDPVHIERPRNQRRCRVFVAPQPRCDPVLRVLLRRRQP